MTFRLSDQFPPDQPWLQSEFRAWLREGTVLENFIASHLQAVPTKVERKGTHKGDPLPFGRKKVHAALLHLKLGGAIADLGELARTAKVSYSLLAKWRTERRFTEAVRRFETDLWTLTVGFISAWVQDNDAVGSVEHSFLDVDRALQIVSEFKEIEAWSPDLRQKIFFALVLNPEGLIAPKGPAVIHFVMGLIGFALSKSLLSDHEVRNVYPVICKRLHKIIDGVISALEKAQRDSNRAAELSHTRALRAITHALRLLES